MKNGITVFSLFLCWLWFRVVTRRPNKTAIFVVVRFNLLRGDKFHARTKQDRHVYVMSSDHGNPDGGGTGDIGSDEYSHYKAL